MTNKNVRSANDTMHPIAVKLAQCKSYSNQLIAGFIGLGDGFKPKHYVDEDLRMESLDVLLIQRKSLKDSGGGQELLSVIDEKILSYLFSDQQLPIRKSICKRKLVPFSDKTDIERMTIINTGRARKIDIVKHDYSAEIFNKIEQDTGEDFYSLDFNNQTKIFQAYADQILKELTSEAPQEPDINRLTVG